MYGDRKSSIIHARLRKGCSSLKYDLFSLNIINSPKCDCGKLVNIFFFIVDFMQEKEEILFNNLNNIGFIISVHISRQCSFW